MHSGQQNLFMSESLLTLVKAILFVDFPEMYRIFSEDWLVVTEVEYEALQYLVEHISSILLPNVTLLDEREKELLHTYKGQLQIG